MSRHWLLAAWFALAPLHAAEVFSERERPAFDALVNTLAPTAATLAWPELLQAAATHPSLLGARYEANPLDRGAKGIDEPLRAGFDGFDCVTYVETVLALARTVAIGKTAADDYAAELARLRYGDAAPGYCARRHYFGDWSDQQVAAGRLDEITTELAGDPGDLAVLRVTHGFDFLTRNAAKTPALAASPARLACVAEQEATLTARVEDRGGTAYIRSTSLREVSRRLRPGDVIAFVADVPGLDVLHVGLVVQRPSGRLELAQASQRDGRVLVSPDLLRYARGLRQQRGVRVFRPRDPRSANP